MELIGADAASALTRKLATFSHNFKLSDAPEEARSNAKLAILDCLGVAVLAATQEVGRSLMHMAEDEGWSGPCTIWGTTRSASSRDAAFASASGR